jgi:hypothetical protein
MANTPIRTVRIPDHIWEAVKQKAQSNNVTVTAIILNALKTYGGTNE